MRLKVNDTEEFNLAMDLNVDYEGECITVVVRFWDKKKHRIIDKEFAADEFSKALACFSQCEQDYILRKEVPLPWRIWFRCFNIDGEVISEGVSVQTYTRKNDAVREARRLYGPAIPGMSRQWTVSKTNPWDFIEHEGVVHGFASGIK